MPSDLLIVGCGHSESIRHYNNNAMLRTPDGNLLLDSGYTIKRALDAQSLTLEQVDAVYISHVHGDHVFGLERLAYETRYKYEKKIDLIFHESLYDELWHQTLRGSLGRNGEGEASLDDYFNVRQVSSFSFDHYGHHFDLVAVDHTPGKPAFGVLIDEDIFYSTDTVAMPDVIPPLNFRIGFHDVTLTDWNPVHATLGSLLSTYPESVRKKMFLMSYEDHFEDYRETVEANFAGFAHQGQVIPLK